MKPFLLLIMMGVSIGVWAQASKFEVGLEAGPTRSTLRGNEMLDWTYDPLLSYTGGAFFQYNFYEALSIRTGLAFEWKGAFSSGLKVNINGTNSGRLKNYYNIDYLTFPLLIRATFGDEVKLFANAGPYLGYLLRQTFVSQLGNGPKRVIDYTEAYQRIDWGLTLGLGTALSIRENWAVTVEIRNNLGLYNISAVPVYKNGTVQTNSTMFLLGIGYQIKSGVN